MYQVGALQTVKLFGEDGKRQIFRDPVNQRKQKTVDVYLQKSLSKLGLVPGVSGEPWFCLSGEEKPPYLAISFGTRTRGINWGGQLGIRFTRSLTSWLSLVW